MFPTKQNYGKTDAMYTLFECAECVPTNGTDRFLKLPIRAGADLADHGDLDCPNCHSKATISEAINKYAAEITGILLDAKNSSTDLFVFGKSTISFQIENGILSIIISCGQKDREPFVAFAQDIGSLLHEIPHEVHLSYSGGNATYCKCPLCGCKDFVRTGENFVCQVCNLYTTDEITFINSILKEKFHIEMDFATHQGVITDSHRGLPTATVKINLHRGDTVILVAPLTKEEESFLEIMKEIEGHLSKYCRVVRGKRKYQI